MKRPILLALVLLSSTISSGQAPGVAGGETRAQKLRTILQVQDLRSGGDTLFRRYLHDPDTLVRARATLACANLQDTSLMARLLTNLVEGPLPVQDAAAFAIGQTAPSMARASADSLAHEIVSVRLDRTAAHDRMLEELGKFGSERELNELVLRGGKGGPAGRDPFLMAVARFAIRGISTPEATSFAVESLLGSAGSGWRAAYALQRIGDNERMRADASRLIGALSHPDPLVRMNIAALFGKLKADSTLVAPLLEVSLTDADWRVRVNALKALGNHPPDSRVTAALGEAISDDNESVVLTALSVIAGYGGNGPGERGVAGVRGDLEALVPVVRRIAAGEGRPDNWRYRAGAAMALAKLEGGASLADLAVPPGADPLFAAGLIAAMGETGAPEAMGAIAPYLHVADPLYRRTALEAVQSLLTRNPADGPLRDSAYAASIAALTSGDMAVVTTAAANLGDSLFLGRDSAPALCAALGKLRPAADIEAIQEVCKTLAKIGDTSAAGALRSVIASGYPPAALAAATALTALTGEPSPAAIGRGGAPLHADFDFGYLESLPETIAVKLRTGEGEILMEWYRDAAPFTIMSLLKLAGGSGFYRGLIFHRVVPNFVVQGGDPRGDGWGGPGYSLRSEFSPLSYGAGTVGIASAGKDTEGSQFFITHSPQPHLDGRYTIIGNVVGGMDVVDRIQVGDGIIDLERTGR
jgi:cyclophilin family peptidyl-prolyl cis-trans isomerase/HEAT repeat protein